MPKFAFYFMHHLFHSIFRLLNLLIVLIFKIHAHLVTIISNNELLVNDQTWIVDSKSQLELFLFWDSVLASRWKIEDGEWLVLEAGKAVVLVVARLE